VVLAVSSKALSVGISLLAGILTGKSAKFQVLFRVSHSHKPRDSRYLGHPRGPLWPKNNSEIFRRIREFDFPVMGSNSERIWFFRYVVAKEIVPGARWAHVYSPHLLPCPTSCAGLSWPALSIIPKPAGPIFFLPSRIGGSLFCRKSGHCMGGPCLGHSYRAAVYFRKRRTWFREKNCTNSFGRCPWRKRSLVRIQSCPSQ